MSMQARLLSAVFALICTLGVCSAVLEKRLVQTSEDLLRDSMRSYSKLIETEVAAGFERESQALRQLGNRLRDSQGENLEPILNEFASSRKFINVVTVLDPAGRVLFVSTKTAGKIKHSDYSKEEWFRSALAGKESIGDAEFNSAMAQATGRDGLSQRFVVPVPAKNGQVAYVLSSQLDFSWVESRFQQLYGVMSAHGYSQTDFILLDRLGSVLVDFDPASKAVAGRDPNVILKLNLVELNVEAARAAVAGKEGVMESTHARKKIAQIAGYNHFQDERFPRHLGWSALVRVSRDEALGPLLSVQRWFYVIFGLVTLVAGILSIYGTRKLAGSLDLIVSGLKSGAEAATVTASEASGVGAGLSEASVQQAAAIQQTAASVEEVSAMIKRNAENTTELQKNSNNCKLVVDEGRAAMARATEAITEISAGNDRFAKQIETGNAEIAGIVRVISDISAKTQVINDIVFQTKLLSFNASVEAARAGEHGKGFAVVAEEVGKLAQMSGIASLEISQMLDSSIKQVEEIVRKTTSEVNQLAEEGNARIGAGRSRVEECSEVLARIMATVDENNQRVTSIASATDEQAQGMNEISKAMNQLEQVTQQTSKMAQKSAASAENTQSQAVNLKGLVESLNALVHGRPKPAPERQAPVVSAPSKGVKVAKVLPLKKAKAKAAPVAKSATKGAAALKASAIPSQDDPRFEEV